MSQRIHSFFQPRMSQKTAEILLASVIIARSTSFIFNKLGVGEMSIFNLIALRYLAAFSILLIPFHSRLKGLRLRTVLTSALLSGFFFLIMMAELTGLKTADSSVICFLENSAVVFVPLVSSLLACRLPAPAVLLSSGTALAGVFLLTARSGIHSLGTGEAFGILAALFYTAYIIITARMVPEKEAFQIGILQNGFLGLYGLGAAFVTGTARLPHSRLELVCILMLAIVCSAFGLTLQPVAQSHTTAERAGLFCALSPVSASLLGFVFLHEKPGIAGLIGAALILFSIFIPRLASRMPAKAGRLLPRRPAAGNI